MNRTIGTTQSASDTLDKFILRLAKVKRTGSGRWIACCPAHDDKRPSLCIRLTNEGRILMHCFAGCDIESVVHAAGLNFADLMPENLHGNFHSDRRPFPASDVLRCIAFEALLTMVAARMLVNGEVLSAVDHERLLVAVERIQSGLTAAGVSL